MTSSMNLGPAGHQEYEQHNRGNVFGAKPGMSTIKYDRPRDRTAFEIAIICALSIESDAMEALFDEFWEDEEQYEKAKGDTNSYTVGRIGQHNVVLAYMPGMGKAASAGVAASFRSSFPSIRLGLVVGICGGVPRTSGRGDEIYLGDVVISTALVQSDFGRQYSHGLVRKDTLQDNLGRPNLEIRGFLSKMQGWRGRKGLRNHISTYLADIYDQEEFADWKYPGSAEDKLYNSFYRHKHQDPAVCILCAQSANETDEVCEAALESSCADLGCHDSQLITRERNTQVQQASHTGGHIDDTFKPLVHFGIVASGDHVMKSGHYRDQTAAKENVIAFEMEGAGVWDNFPTVVLKGVCDYADSHKNKRWQRVAAATAAACAKAFLKEWRTVDRLPQREAELAFRDQETLSTLQTLPDLPLGSYIPSQRNPRFSGREDVFDVMDRHYEQSQNPKPYILRGMGGIGKTQIALEYAYRRQDLGSTVFWVSCFTLENIVTAFKQIQRAVKAIRDHQDEEDRVAVLRWFENHGNWVLIFDNADDGSIAYGDWIPRSKGVSPAGRVLFTSRDERLAGGIVGFKKEVPLMNDVEAMALFSAGSPTKSQRPLQENNEIRELVQRLGNLPLAISLASAYLRECPWIAICEYLQHLDRFADRKEFFTYKEAFSNYNHSIMSTWEISFSKIKQDNPRAADILILLGFLANNMVTLQLLKKVLRSTLGLGSKNSNFGIRADLRMELEFLRDDLGLVKALGLLRSLAIIEFDGTTVSFHPLVHEWIQTRLAPADTTEWAVKAMLVIFYAYISYEYPVDGRVGAARGFWDHTNVALSSAYRGQVHHTIVAHECYLFLLTLLIVKGVPVIKAVSVHKMLDKFFMPTDNDSPMAQFRRRVGQRLDTLKLPKGIASRPSMITSQTGFCGEPTVFEDPNSDLSQVATKFESALHPEIKRSIDSCKEFANGLAELCSIFAMVSRFDHLHVNQGITETTCLKLQEILAYSASFEAVGLPPEIVEFLFLWTSMAAMNLGYRIPIWLEKPLEPMRIRLFEEAYSFTQRMDPTARSPVILESLMTFARYLDQRSKTGPSAWLYIEQALIDNLGYAFEYLDAELAIYMDFFCQSMWECDHEDALYTFCNLIGDLDRRISNKWSTKVSARWKVLGKSFDVDKVSGFEATLLSTFRTIMT